MEPQEKKHELLKPLLITLAGIVLVGATGFGVWYWQSGENQKQKTESDKQISDLQKQINDLKKEESTSDTTKPPAPQKKSIRDVDFTKIIKIDPGSSFLANQYADYNGDGSEEALVTVSIIGSGQTKFFYVYGYKDGTELTRYLTIDNAGPAGIYVSGYNGHDNIAFTDGRFIFTYPVYGPDDANCCPTGGTKYTYFKWNGSSFVIDKQERK